MYYFIFDMDETIVDLYSIFYFIVILRIASFNPEISFSESLQSKLQTFYRFFVKYVSEIELSDNKLGIFRPGSLDIMKKLRIMRDVEIIDSVIIYSNNGCIECIEFVKDVIHETIHADNLICDCIHAEHPMRMNDKTDDGITINKSWDVLKNILINGPCHAPIDIQPYQIIFFDDLYHDKMSETNYFQVPPYSFKASYDRLSSLFIRAYNDTKLTSDEEKEYFSKLFEVHNIDTAQLSFNKIIEIFRGYVPDTAPSNLKIINTYDEGIEIMNYAINLVNNIYRKSTISEHIGGFVTKKGERGRHVERDEQGGRDGRTGRGGCDGRNTQKMRKYIQNRKYLSNTYKHRRTYRHVHRMRVKKMKLRSL
jgi:hypothetical protein